MTLALPRRILLLGSLIVSLATASQLSAQVTVLDFDGGNGAASVDQFKGTSGGGWSAGWSNTFHSGTTNGSASVLSTSPLTTGGGNYLNVGFDTLSTGTSLARASRQWDTTQLNLTAPISLEFDFRSHVNVSSSTETFVIFGSSASATGTGSNDSWTITSSGAGWKVLDGTTSTNLFSGTILADETWHFVLTINPVTDTYSVTAQNITTSSELYSASALALRNGADASLSVINFNATGAASLTGLGFDIDALSVSSAIPEPSAASLIAGVSVLGWLALVRRQRR